MDATGLLGLLVVIVACDTVAIGALLVLTLRRPTSVDRREYWQALAARSAQRGPQMPTPAGPTVVPPVGAIPRVDDAAQPQLVPAGERDPLADAISAFLSRGDGLFRAGAAGGAVAGGTAGAATDEAADAETPSDAVPVEAAAAVPAGGRDVPAIGPRSGPEIASPMRPSRYVASGSVPMDRSGPSDEPTGPATPGPTGIPGSIVASRGTDLPGSIVAPGPASSAGGPDPDIRPGPVVPARPATRLSVALVGLDPQPSIVAEAALVAAVARLSPVIGGLLRERSRGRDVVRIDGPGRFSVDLPDTTADGAGGLATRLADSCESWLAAELPPLRLELELADLTGRSIPSGAPTGRPNGPERRRSLTLDA